MIQYCHPKETRVEKAYASLCIPHATGRKSYLKYLKAQKQQGMPGLKFDDKGTHTLKF